MSENALSQNVGRLLDRFIFSVSQLETLLFLRKFSQRKWTLSEIANELHTNDAAALEMLSLLVRCELIRQSGSGNIDQYFYDATNEALNADIEQLSSAYKKLRLRVVDRIYQKPKSASSLHEIADSFIIRQEPD